MAAIKEKSMLRVLCFAVLISCGTVYGGEEASVLVKEPVQEVAVQEVVKSKPCCVRCRLYNVEESCTDSCRKKLFGGGYVKKTTVKKVYKPVN